MKIEGIKAKHAIVSPVCRTNHGKDVAAQIAVDHLLDEYDALVDLPFNEGATFHFVLSVERDESIPKGVDLIGSRAPTLDEIEYGLSLDTLANELLNS
jgi:hypothetical protein